MQQDFLIVTMNDNLANDGTPERPATAAAFTKCWISRMKKTAPDSLAGRWQRHLPPAAGRQSL